MVSCGANRVWRLVLMVGVCGGLAAAGPLRADEAARAPRPPVATTDAQVRAALEEPATFDFDETPLDEALVQIADRHRITVWIDQAEITQLGQRSDLPVPRTEMPVKETIRGVPLGRALTQLLEPLDLGYYVEDGAVKVTDARRARSRQWRQTWRPPVLCTGAAEENIYAALDNPQGVDLQFVEIPLSDAMRVLADSYQITILIDRASLEAEGVPTDEPLNIVLSGVTLRSALHLMLEPLGLTAVVADEVLKVTTRKSAGTTRITRIYDLRSVADQRLRNELPDMLRELVAPESWTSPGTGIRPIGPDALAVTQTLLVHEQIEPFLGQVRTIAQRKAADESAAR